MHLSKSIFLFSAIVIFPIFRGNCQNLQLAANNQVAYTWFKKGVNHDKGLLINQPAKDISAYLFKLINADIYNYWAGTPWEFHGVTRQPKTGSIACGYFVTNTLTDLGLKIDRVGLAEGRSGDMIKKLCVGIRLFNSLGKLDSYLVKQPNIPFLSLVLIFTPAIL